MIDVLEHKKYLEKIQEDDAVLVCSTESHFDDGEWTECAECGIKITYRPYNELAKKKICIDCSMKLMEDDK